MKPLLTIFLLALTLGGCTTYQYLALAGEQMRASPAQDLCWSNDTLLVRYRWNGPWGALQLQVQNTSAVPFSVNWQKSALVYQGTAYPLYQTAARFHGNASKPLDSLNEVQPPLLADLNGKIEWDSPISFLPPATTATQRVNTSAAAPQLWPLPDSLPVQYQAGESGNIKYQRQTYVPGTSPFSFEVVLTIEHPDRAVVLTHHFYAQEIVQTRNHGPFMVFIQQAGNKCYAAVRD